MSTEPKPDFVTTIHHDHGSDVWRVVIFALYSVVYEAIIWGGFGYVVFWMNRSNWWMLLAVLLSGSQLRPQHFGIKNSR